MKLQCAAALLSWSQSYILIRGVVANTVATYANGWLYLSIMLISKPIFDQSGCLLCIHRSIAVSSVTAALKYDSATKFIFKFDSLDSENLLLSKWEMSQKCSIQTTADHMMSGGSLCISKLSLHILLGHQRLRYGTTAPQQLMSMLHLGVPNYLNVLVGLTVLHLFSL